MFKPKTEKEKQHAMDAYIKDQGEQMIAFTAAVFVISGVIATLTGGPIALIIGACVGFVLLCFFISISVAACCPSIHPALWDNEETDGKLNLG